MHASELGNKFRSCFIYVEFLNLTICSYAYKYGGSSLAIFCNSHCDGGKPSAVGFDFYLLSLILRKDSIHVLIMCLAPSMLEQ